MRRPEAVARWRQALTDDIGFYEFQQISLRSSGNVCKGYANSQGIRLVGDIPTHVAFDGGQLAHLSCSSLTKNEPVAVAGCPLDAFVLPRDSMGESFTTGSTHRETGYDWWMKRMAYSFKLYDQVRAG